MTVISTPEMCFNQEQDDGPSRQIPRYDFKLLHDHFHILSILWSFVWATDSVIK
jgi:hypothetical protein